MEVWKNELYHHGILGQKWGIRRFQNPDGTRTALGKQREKEQYREATNPKRTTSAQRRKMTNAELEARIKRLKLEKQVKDLEKETISTGRSMTEDILKSSGKKVATQILTAAAIAAVGAGVTYALYKSSGSDAKDFAADVLRFAKGVIPNAKNQW